MKSIVTYFVQPKTLLGIVGVQTLLILIMGGVLMKNSKFYHQQSMVLAESATGQTANFSDDIQSCFQLPVADRPTCAKIIGTKLANSDESMQDKIRTCMDLRPIYNRYCLEALQISQ